MIYETEMSEDAYSFSFRGRNGWGWGTVKCNGVLDSLVVLMLAQNVREKGLIPY